MAESTGSESRLCFLEASCVKSPAGALGGRHLHSQQGELLGTLDGVLIDPTERRVRFFVVETPGWLRKRKYLISADTPTKVETDGTTLRLDIESDALVRDEFDCRTVRKFSEEDAVEAMFARQVA